MLTGDIKDRFEILESERIEDADLPGAVTERIVFQSPAGKMKLEFSTRPAIVDKKTHGSRRIGGDTSVEYIYSDEDFVYKLHAFRFSEGSDMWEEMKASDFLPDGE